MKKQLFGLVSAGVLAFTSVPYAAVAAGNEVTEQPHQGKTPDGSYSYSWWNDENMGETSFDGDKLNGGEFSCSWKDVYSCSFAKGHIFEEADKSYKELGDISCDYTLDYSSKGNSFYGIHGWVENRETGYQQNKYAEFLIVDGYVDYRPHDGETPLSSVTVDGCTYDIYRVKNASFDSPILFQYVSVISSEDNKANGETPTAISHHISIDDHFAAWEKAGIDMSGGLYEVSFDVEGWKSSGEAVVRKNDIEISSIEKELLPGDMKVTLLDYDTGKPIAFNKDEDVPLWTDISYILSGEKVMTGPRYQINKNPSVISDITQFFDADNFSFGLSDAPDGYSLPVGDIYAYGWINGKSVPDDYVTVKKNDNGSAEVAFKLKKDESDKRTMIVTVKEITGDTLLLKSNVGDMTLSTEYLDTGIEPYVGMMLEVTFTGGILATYPGQFGNVKKVRVISEGTEIQPGDVNRDGDFTIADLVLLQKWMIGTPGAKLIDKKAADINGDGKINVFDLCLMKRRFFSYDYYCYIEPDNKFDYGMLFFTVKDDLKLYLGPDESYKTVASIPIDSRMWEMGYNDNNNEWLFTEYKGTYGWIKVVDELNNPTVHFEAIAKKPVIYLYPEEETDVHVELNLKEADLSTTYPRYNNGWDVTAYPGGSLLNKADGTHHKYLFWDAVNCRTKYDFSKGFCVAGSDTESFLKEKLTYMGLTEEEMNEFIVYWLPQMEHNKYNLISFQGDAYTNSAELNITPKPDSLLRVFMTYIPLEDEVDIEPQQLETFERKGFTVVEWGGSEISH